MFILSFIIYRIKNYFKVRHEVLRNNAEHTMWESYNIAKENPNGLTIKNFLLSFNEYNKLNEEYYEKYLIIDV